MCTFITVFFFASEASAYNNCAIGNVQYVRANVSPYASPAGSTTELLVFEACGYMWTTESDFGGAAVLRDLVLYAITNAKNVDITFGGGSNGSATTAMSLNYYYNGTFSLGTVYPVGVMRIVP
tara:strand:+ start:265 stop:633 length:369 start_codon:yes stop_codon:yes gene_type:complete